MAVRNTFSTVYIYSEGASRLGRVSVVKLVNDKIDEILFDLKERVESRDDIDLIYKSFPSVTVLMQGKDFVLRVADDTIRVVSVKRLQGMSFEIVRPKMVRLEIFDGVDANMYMATQCIGKRHDNPDIKVDLPAIAQLLTPDQVDAKFNARRQRKEERERNLKTPARTSATGERRVLPIAHSSQTLRESKGSDEIRLKVISMNLSPDHKVNTPDNSIKKEKDEDWCHEDESLDVAEKDDSLTKTNTINTDDQDEDDDDDGEDEVIDDSHIVSRIDETAKRDRYEFDKSMVQKSLGELSQARVFSCYYSMSANKKKIILERKSGSISSTASRRRHFYPHSSDHP